MKRPCLPLVLWFVGGILMSAFLQPPWWWAGVLAWLLALGLLCWPARRAPGISGLLLASGCALHAMHTQIISPHDLRLKAGEEAAWVHMEGTLCTPLALHAEVDDDDVESWRTTAILGAERIKWPRGDWQAVHGRVAVTTRGRIEGPYHAGSPVVIEGILAPPPTPVAPGLFHYRNHLARKGIHYQLKAPSPEAWTDQRATGESHRSLWPERFSAWARGALAQGLPEEDQNLRLLWAMTLGWKLGLTDEVSEPFMRSGTMHVFAISGLHVALIAGCLLSLLRLGRVSRASCAYLVIPWLWFYTLAIGQPASAVRASAMMSVIIAGWSLRRPGDLLNSLAGAALLVLIWDPRQLFQTGFQLSFSVVGSLALFGPWLSGLRRHLLQPDPLLPDELRPRWKKVIARPAHYIVGSFATSAAAWLGSLPLIAFYFHYFTPVSLAANVVIIPLSGLALTSCVASLATVGWWPAAGELFNHSAWFWMNSMVAVSERAAAVPGAWRYIPAPSLIGLLLYYGILVSALSGWFRSTRWRPRVLGILGALFLGCVGQNLSQRDALRLSILPAQGGEAIVVEGRHRLDPLLIDVGDERSARFVTRAFLQSHGINRIPRLLLTHGDIRHVGGLGEILHHFEIIEVGASPVNFRSAVYRRWLAQLEETGRLTRISAGTKLGDWTVLHPSAQSKHPQADDNALVLWTEAEGVRILLLSDLGFPGQDELLNRHPDLRADIVVAGLPIQSEPAAEGLLHLLDPRLVIINDAGDPKGSRAAASLRRRLEHHTDRRRIIYTADVGAVILRCRSGRCDLEYGSGAEEALHVRSTTP